MYWAVQFDNPAVLAKAEQQLQEEIDTSRNHAAIILWSMAYETSNTEARTRFITTEAERAREIDPTRLITAALLVRTEGNTKIVDDALGKALDVIGANEYIGWYENRPETADVTQWRIAYQKPLIMSELGGEAKAGLHGGPNDRWTEEYQANIYRHQSGMLNRIPQLSGISPWILMDFRSPKRTLAGMQDGFNRKGLISEQGEKRQAFYVLQKAYKDKVVTMSDSKPDNVSRSLPEQPVPHFANADVGSPKLTGSATPTGSGFDMIAGGADIWEKTDQFHFAYREISGDFDIAVRVESFTPAHPYSKAGLMLRESLDTASAHFMFFVFSDNRARNNNLGGYEMQFRSQTGDNCQAIYPEIRPPAPPEFPAAYPNSWLRMTRRGNRFSAYGSTDGQNWKLYGEKTLALADTLKVGMALTSHNPDTAAKASFRDYREVK